MNSLSKPDQKLLNRLNRHPHLKERRKSLLAIAEKLYWHSTLGLIEVNETVYRKLGQRLRPFSQKLANTAWKTYVFLQDTLGWIRRQPSSNSSQNQKPWCMTLRLYTLRSLIVV
ncbi:MAG: hypothetical protein HC877_01720 [Thioploca sp.]|nr:hypothetical protein [Thioploca sp.]